jgi:DNA-binding transcriptional regulator/RsmH inhibitor MraZ
LSTLEGFPRLRPRWIGPDWIAYNDFVPHSSEPPDGLYVASIDEKLRLKLPKNFLAAMKPHRKWFVTSRDGKTIEMYPAEAGKPLRTGPKKPDQNKKPNTSSGERHLLDSQLDLSGRFMLPPLLDASAELRGQNVWVSWEDDRIVLLKAKPTSRSFGGGPEKCR